MTDNVTFGANTFAADDIGSGILAQRIKLDGGGVDGAFSDVGPTNPLNVTTPDDTFTVTPTLDTVAYSQYDILFVATLIDANTSRASGKTVTLSSIVVADKTLNQPEMLLLFFDSSITIGTINTTINLSSANAFKLVGQHNVVKSDWTPFTSSALVDGDVRPRQMKPAVTSLYVAGIYAGAAAITYANGDLQFKFGFSR